MIHLKKWLVEPIPFWLSIFASIGFLLGVIISSLLPDQHYGIYATIASVILVGIGTLINRCIKLILPRWVSLLFNITFIVLAFLYHKNVYWQIHGKLWR